jgi:hypothetical protein
MLALIAAFEVFRPAPAMTQRSMESHVRDVVSELREIRRELAARPVVFVVFSGNFGPGWPI